MKQYRVRLADEAQRNFVDIYRYVATYDSVDAAGYLLDELEKLCANLTSLAQQGNVPPELERRLLR